MCLVAPKEYKRELIERIRYRRRRRRRRRRLESRERRIALAPAKVYRVSRW